MTALPPIRHVPLSGEANRVMQGVIAKAGVLPFYINIHSGRRVYGLTSPKPKQGDLRVPFVLARGTKKLLLHGEAEWRDIRGNVKDILISAPHKVAAIQTHYANALDEMEEELGLTESDVHWFGDCGPVAYKDYFIYLYSAEIPVEAATARAPDAHAVLWADIPTLIRMAEEGSVKATYLPIIRKVDTALDRRGQQI